MQEALDHLLGAVRAVSDTETVATIDATGRVVAPGWVDVHTHYDGQATWDAEMAPSSWHGVTTVVMGNCGVGFAPVRPGKEDELVQLMESVEDIPGTALHEGLPWGWETFSEYLDCLDATPRAIDVGVLVPHGAVRTYLMGEPKSTTDFEYTRSSGAISTRADRPSPPGRRACRSRVTCLEVCLRQ